jgi:ribosomal protein S18 acetylase RimI-like enzyme
MGMETGAQPLECRKLTAEWKHPLLAFLSALEAANETENFHPHPFTESAVDQILRDARKDLYYILAEGKEVLGYGMLRGWDEGYEIPSLGIAIHPRVRGTGLGKVFMHFLHAAVRRRGGEKVRLRVNMSNGRARTLYERLGYRFQAQEGQYLVGYLELDGDTAMKAEHGSSGLIAD